MVTESFPNYFKNKKVIADILSNYFKNQTERVSKIPSNYFENRTQMVTEVLSNYLVQKQNKKWSSKFFQITSKARQMFTEIFSNCFKNNTQKNPRDSFKLFGGHGT